MLAAISVISIGAVIFLAQGITLMKQKRKQEVILFTSLLLLAVLLQVAILVHLPVPTLANIIGTMLGPLVRPIVRWLEGVSA